FRMPKCGPSVLPRFRRTPLCSRGSACRALSISSRSAAKQRTARGKHSKIENRKSKILSRKLRRYPLDSVQHEPHSAAALNVIAVRVELEKQILTEVPRDIAILISCNRGEITWTAKLGRREGPLIDHERDRTQVCPN